MLKPFLTLSLVTLLSFQALAADAPANAKAKAAETQQRVEADQALMQQALKFKQPSAEAKAWFDGIRQKRSQATDPEVQAALDQVLLLDPAGEKVSPLGKDAVKPFIAPVGQTPETKLAQTERQLDFNETPLALSAAELKALTESADFPIAQRASRLLRRIDPATAAPILWTRLSKLTQRSQILEVEDELLRLPLKNVTAGAPAALSGSMPAKAAVLRIMSVRPALKVSKDILEPLLKGAPNELTEAAWDAVPRVYTAADKAALQGLLAGLSERLKPRAQAAIAALK
jgi:hypothetical protein